MGRAGILFRRQHETSLAHWRCLVDAVPIPPSPGNIQSFSTWKKKESDPHSTAKNKKKKEVDTHSTTKKKKGFDLAKVIIPSATSTFLTPEQKRELTLSNLRRLQKRQRRQLLQPPEEDSFSTEEDEVVSPLTEQQKKVLKAVAQGDSVFLTGSAGTGKSFLLSHVIRLLKKIHGPGKVFVTASTGVSACALDGQTLHSFAGIGLGTEEPELLLQRIESSKHSRKRWMEAKALVIDEVSMVDGVFFDNLEFIARKVRNETKVWGGIQLVVAGDFFQLPPVLPRNPEKEFAEKEFAFEADCWDISFDLHVELTDIFRQSDPQFVELLQGIRRGVRNPPHIDLLESRMRETELSDWDSSITQLFPTKADAEIVNEKQLKNLGGAIITYRAVDSGKEPWKSQLQKGIAPDELDLCVGARVMLIKNKSVGKGFVNGSTGTVVGFKIPKSKNVGFPKIENEGFPKIPNGKKVEFSKSENEGFSKISKSKNVEFSKSENEDFRGKNVQFSNSKNVTTDLCRNKLWPLVQLDSGGQKIVIKPCTWDVVVGESVMASRLQVPLILAWALSIHKCQGMTLDFLRTDLSRAFGYGMVYVALSRVRHFDGLQLTGLNKKKIRAHPKVLQFYENLQKDSEKILKLSQL